jgi:zinc transport system substrate-binding protein
MAKHALTISGRLVIAAIVLTVGLVDAARAEAPRVVASIAPVDSLVANVMAGVGEPRLLIRGFGSPHAYQLRPSEAADLARADVVFWIGAGLETVLARPLSALAEQARIVTLGEHPGLTRWPARTSGAWATVGEEDDHANDHTDDHTGHGLTDQHLWLAPTNASVMVRAIADALVEIDPANQQTYQDNAARTIHRIDTLASTIDRQLTPLRHVPYVVLHDAFQYFERSFGLNAVGAVSVSPDRPPSARRLHDLRIRIRQLDAACAFSEPQMSSALIETLIEGTAMKRDVLDPLGATVPSGPGAYFAMMAANADALARCLSTAK